MMYYKYFLVDRKKKNGTPFFARPQLRREDKSTTTKVATIKICY